MRLRKQTPSFDQGDSAAAVIGMKVEPVSGRVSYMVSWLNAQRVESWVSSADVRQHAPIELIDFFEKNAVLVNPSAEIIDSNE